LNSAPPSDPDWTAQLEKERQDEIQVIGGACDSLGREIYEVSPISFVVGGPYKVSEAGANDRLHLMDIVCLMQSRINYTF